MKKLLSSVYKTALILTLATQSPFAMESGEKTETPSKVVLVGNSKNTKPPKFENPNKEFYNLHKDNFSSENKINFKGIYKHIHYIFKNEKLLLESLYPLLSENLNIELSEDLYICEKRYNHLEFLGDSVLALIIRERIVQLFPDDTRTIHVQLYDSLIRNKTLADAYLQNLDIEPYLPYPGEIECEYCNVVEALIGGIYTDAQDKGMIESRKFVMRILDDHLLNIKRKEVLEKNGIVSVNNAQKYSILPNLEKTINDLIENDKIDKTDPKSMLGMILGKTLQDRPEYNFTIGKNTNDLPVFVVNVIASQIGDKITGIGFSKHEAEQEAARKAINFLAQKIVIPTNRLNDLPQCYRKFIIDYCQSKGIKMTLEEISGPNRTTAPIFVFQAKIGDEIIEKGSGLSMQKAKENAAKNAYISLVKNGKIVISKSKNDRSYESILGDWMTENDIFDYQADLQPTSTGFKYQIKLFDEDAVGEGSGSSENDAIEDASYNLYYYLIINGRVENLKFGSDKSYQSMLHEWISQNEVSDYCLAEIETPKLNVETKFQVKICEDIVGVGTGSNTKIAKENACQSAFDQLLKQQDDELKEREIRKITAKKVNPIQVFSLTPHKKPLELIKNNTAPVSLKLCLPPYSTHLALNSGKEAQQVKLAQPLVNTPSFYVNITAPKTTPKPLVKSKDTQQKEPMKTGKQKMKPSDQHNRGIQNNLQQQGQRNNNNGSYGNNGSYSNSNGGYSSNNGGNKNGSNSNNKRQGK